MNAPRYRVRHWRHEMISLRAYMQRIEAHRARQRTRQLIERLPEHLRNDIGNPHLDQVGRR